MSQKFPVNKFERIEETSQFNEDFRKNYNDQSDEGYFLELMFHTHKNYTNFIMTFHFYQKENKFKKYKSLLLIYMMKINMSFTTEI